MDKKILKSIVCPVCKGEFFLEVFAEEDEAIEEGSLNCICGQSFPIIAGIPRILIGDLKEIVLNQFPEFFLKYKEFFASWQPKNNITGESLKKKKTAESFGYEWQKFHEMKEEWRKNFDFYFEPADKPLLKEKTVLELGCGNGRHTFYASKICKELFAVDLGSAIDIAYLNNKDKNINFIQADIYNLPFKDNFFDFIFCLGVLHHLPTPEKGFNRLVDLLKNNGEILIYVYHSFAEKTFNFYLLKFVNFFRNFTIRLPHKLLYVLSYPIALLSYLILVLPYKFFFKKRGKIDWPLGTYVNYSFSVLLNDTFDRFSAPIENRYSKEQILEWYQRAGLKNIKILGGSGWRLLGNK